MFLLLAVLASPLIEASPPLIQASNGRRLQWRWGQGDCKDISPWCHSQKKYCSRSAFIRNRCKKTCTLCAKCTMDVGKHCSASQPGDYTERYAWNPDNEREIQVILKNFENDFSRMRIQGAYRCRVTLNSPRGQLTVRPSDGWKDFCSANTHMNDAIHSVALGNSSTGGRPTPECYQIDIAHKGDNIKSEDGIRSARECQKLCQDTRKCTHWTWMGTQFPRCYIKKYGSDPRNRSIKSKEGAVSGSVGSVNCAGA